MQNQVLKDGFNLKGKIKQGERNRDGDLPITFLKWNSQQSGPSQEFIWVSHKGAGTQVLEAPSSAYKSC